MRLLRKSLRLMTTFMDPWQNLLLVNAFATTFLESFCEAYTLADSSREVMIMSKAIIECPCGHSYVKSWPDRYSGKGAYPQRCPACNGEVKKVANG